MTGRKTTAMCKTDKGLMFRTCKRLMQSNEKKRKSIRKICKEHGQVPKVNKSLK
jgi:hypothetical protein